MTPDAEKMWKPCGGDDFLAANSPADFVAKVRAFMEPRLGERNRCLFRGTSNHEWSLIPSLPRARDGRPWLNLAYLHHIETHSTRIFESRAHLCVDPRFMPTNLAEGEYSLRWWQLMQHHGAKTRILDWTASPYVAAYFACIEHPNKSGAIWMVEQGAHSDSMKRQHDDEFDDQQRRRVPLFASPRDPRREKKRTSLFFRRCVQPDERMSAQQGWFSCAALLEVDHAEIIAEAFHQHGNSPGRWSLKLVIPPEVKGPLLRELAAMNISGETIYPGLDGFARSVGEFVDLIRPGPNYYLIEEGLLTSQADDPSTPPPAASAPPPSPSTDFDIDNP